MSLKRNRMKELLKYISGPDDVTVEWVQVAAKYYGMDVEDISAYLQIPTHIINNVLYSGRTKLTRFQKAAFYYMFNSRFDEDPD